MDLDAVDHLDRNRHLPVSFSIRRLGISLLTRGVRGYSAIMEGGEGGLDPAGAPARRVRLALDLFDLTERMLRQRLRRTRPAASAAEVEASIVAWRLKRPGAEPGDAPGRLRPWPVR